MATKKKQQLTSPIGTAIWPRLNSPDYRWKPENGEYKVTLRLPRDEAAPFIAAIDEALERKYQQCLLEEKKKTLKRGALPYKPVVNDVTGEETGEIDIKFSLLAKVKPKKGDPFEQRPALFDAALKPMSAIVGGGSRIRVSCLVHPWYTALGVGVSLWLKAVQVLELVAPGNDATAYGFGVEDGFTAAEETAAVAGGKDAAGEDEEDF